MVDPSLPLPGLSPVAGKGKCPDQTRRPCWFRVVGKAGAPVKAHGFFILFHDDDAR